MFFGEFYTFRKDNFQIPVLCHSVLPFNCEWFQRILNPFPSCAKWKSCRLFIPHSPHTRHELKMSARLLCCVAERTRRHRHTACQQTGRERTDPEEADRPEPRVQEEHTWGETSRMLPALRRSPPAAASPLTATVIIYWESRVGWVKEWVDGTKIPAWLPK